MLEGLFSSVEDPSLTIEQHVRDLNRLGIQLEAALATLEATIARAQQRVAKLETENEQHRKIREAGSGASLHRAQTTLDHNAHELSMLRAAIERGTTARTEFLRRFTPAVSAAGASAK